MYRYFLVCLCNFIFLMFVLFLLQCYYLDFPDFGLRRVPPGLPRVKAWKNSLVKEFANLDCKAPREYGMCPASFDLLLNLFSQTCEHEYRFFCMIICPKFL